jgi:putative nucleotidyltransferase with HDIG domain
MPPSISRKYHTKERTIKEHIERCLYFATMLCDEFKPSNRLEIFEAVVLHDIGKVVTIKKGKHEGRYYPVTGYTHLKGVKDHGTEGAKLLREYGLPSSICEMVENHMSHWEKKKPTGLDQWIVAASDYLASQDIQITEQQLNKIKVNLKKQFRK